MAPNAATTLLTEITVLFSRTPLMYARIRAFLWAIVCLAEVNTEPSV